MNKSDKQIFKDLAKRLAIAYGSYSIHVGMAHYEKSYFQGVDELGDFWFSLAQWLNEEMDKRMIDRIGNVKENNR